MTFISSFYNAKLGRSESIISGRAVGDTDVSEIKNYIDSYCPVANRMVNGKDSLFIKPIDAEQLVALIMQGHVPNHKSGMAVLTTDSKGNIKDYRQKW